MSAALLEAWIDGSLPPERLPELEAWIAAAPANADAALLALHDERAIRAALAGRDARRRLGFTSRRARHVRSTPRRFPLVPLAVAAASAAAALLAIALWPRAPAPPADVRQVAVAPEAQPAATATVAVIVAGEVVGGGRTSAAGARLAQGQALMAPRPATLRLDLGAELALAAGARLRLPRAGAARMALDDGAVEFTVEPRIAGDPLTVTTPHGEVVLVGTRFRVVVGGGRTAVAVAEGRVRLGGDGAVRELAAGDAVAIGPSSRPLVELDLSAPVAAPANRVPGGPALGLGVSPGFPPLRWNADGLVVSPEDSVWSMPVGDGADLARALAAADAATLTAWVRTVVPAGTGLHAAELSGRLADGRLGLLQAIIEGRAGLPDGWRHVAIAIGPDATMRTWVDGILEREERVDWTPARWQAPLALKLAVPKDHVPSPLAQPAIAVRRVRVHPALLLPEEIAAEHRAGP